MTPPTRLQYGTRFKFTDHGLFPLIWCRKNRHRIGGVMTPPYDHFVRILLFYGFKFPSSRLTFFEIKGKIILIITIKRREHHGSGQ